MKTTIALLFVLTAGVCASAQRLVPSHQSAAAAGPREVVRVNGVPLMSDRLNAAVGAILPQESFHRNVSPARMTELRNQALQTIVDEELEYQRGVAVGIRPAASDVDAALAKLRRNFKSTDDFNTALRRSGATIATARRELARTLTIERAVAQQVTARCAVGADDALQYFRQNPDRFTMPEQLHVYAITIGVDPSGTTAQWAAAKATAQDVLARIRAGAGFDEMARTYSTDSSRTSGGDMGLVHRGSLSEPFEKTVHDLPVGQVSDVIQTIYGYHIVRVSDIRPPHAKTFAEVETTLRNDLTAKRCADQKAAWLDGLRRAATIVIADAK